MAGSLDVKILRILLEETDENHRLTQKAIQDCLARRGETAGPRAVRSALTRLLAEVDDIECDETKRSRSDLGDESRDNTTHSGFYMKHLFTDEILSFLIDMVAFSEHLPVSYRKEMREQLKRLGSKYFHQRELLLDRVPRAENPHFFLNLVLLEEAIQKGCKVSLQYVQYGPDMQLQVRADESGEPRRETVSPYQLAMCGTRYYLICNHDKYDNLIHYRLDRVQNIQILEEQPARPLEELDSPSGARLDLREYWEQHNAFSGDVIRAELQLTPGRIGDAVDTFGSFIQIEQRQAGPVAVISASRKLIRQFAHSYAPEVVVLSPADLQDEVAERLRKSAALYAQNASAAVDPADI
ncbi:MAG: WYL domain-containing protein [Clostridia bacterium]|nr:WYL domain-containing protein [Clostridia bacterium]